MATSKFSIWLMAIRPKTLLAALSPVILGGACAWMQDFRYIPVWVLTALTAMLLQAIANLANDYFDYKHGFDIPGRQGPLRIMQNGLVKPKTFMMVIALFSLVAAGLGLVLVWYGGWPILLVGAVSLAFAFLYSAGPWPLATHAMGEAASVFFFGLVAGGGTYYLQTGGLNLTVLVLSLVPGFIIAGIMMVNNYRDLDLDRQSGKTTLFGIVGPIWARRIFAASIIAAYVIIALTISLSPLVSVWAGLAFLSLPLGIKVIHDIYTRHGLILNTTLAQTALLSFLTCLLLAVGLQV